MKTTRKFQQKVSENSVEITKYSILKNFHVIFYKNFVKNFQKLQ